MLPHLASVVERAMSLTELLVRQVRERLAPFLPAALPLRLRLCYEPVL
jgi:hypothetical protein